MSRRTNKAYLPALIAIALLSLTSCTYTTKYDTYFATEKRRYPIGPTNAHDPRLKREYYNDPAGYFLLGDALVSIVPPVADPRGIDFVHMPSAAKAQSEKIGVPRDVFAVKVKLRPRASTVMVTSPSEYRTTLDGTSVPASPGRWTISADSQYWTCRRIGDVIEVQGRGCVLTLIFDGWSMNSVDRFSVDPGEITVDGVVYRLPVIEFEASVYDW